jgi:pimeloyl-ACP methyl ester carboxylesterase
VSRVLATHEVGDPSGAPVLYLHGSGSSRLEADVYATAAEQLGIRLIAWDRPGAGGSPGYDGRGLGAVVSDARQVLAGLGLPSARAAVGLSGGGTHVLALASLASDIAERYVAVNPGGPATKAALAGLPRKMRLLVSSARRRPWLFRQLARPMERMGTGIEKVVGSRVRSAAMDPHDLAVLRDPQVLTPFAAAAREGARQPGAWITEARMLWAEDWPFEPLAVDAELHVFCGQDDPFRAFADDLAASGAHLHRFPGGHVSGFAPQVLREVLLTARDGGHVQRDRPSSEGSRR